jgi:hypothetical protein
MNARAPRNAASPFSNQHVCQAADMQGFPIVYETI